MRDMVNGTLIFFKNEWMQPVITCELELRRKLKLVQFACREDLRMKRIEMR